MKINNIDFKILKIEISQDTRNITYKNNFTQIPGPQHIEIIAETNNSNYMKLSDWFDGMFYGQTLGVQRSSKIDINYNNVQLIGLYPKDYTFEQNSIKVTFTADYVNGNIYTLHEQQLRKEKLQKINSINENKDK